MAAGGFLRSSSFSLPWYVCLVLSMLLQQELIYKNVIQPSIQKLSFRSDILSREGSSKFNRPLVKFVKHGYHCLAVNIESQIIIRCGDISINPGPDQYLSCFMQNVRSLKAITTVEGSFEPKLRLLQDLVYGHDFDIICLAVTWLNNSINDHEILPTGYNIYRHDRAGRTGGGTLTAIKSSLSSSEIVKPLEFSDLEVNLVEIFKLKYDRSILIVNAYRPPNSVEFVTSFSGLLKSLPLSRYFTVIVMGDFNFPNIQWVDGSGFTNSSTGEDFMFTNLLLDCYLFQLVEHPTRGNNILDLVITNTPTFIQSNILTGPQWSDSGLPSDHYPVVFDFAVHVRLKDHPAIQRFDFKKADFASLNQALMLIPLSNGIDNVSSTGDFDSLWDSWNDLVFAALNTYVPKVNCRHANRPPWITKDLAKAINKKKTLWRRIKKSKTPANMENFRKLRQHIKNWIRSERRNYIKTIANEVHTNSKRFWTFFTFKNKKKPVPEKIVYNNFTFSDDRARAEAFSEFFKSVFKDHSGCKVNLEKPTLPKVNTSLYYIQVKVEEISKLLSSLDVHKALGSDNMPTVLLKECAESLAPSITAVINFSLREGVQLTNWKKANVSPIFKKGNSNLAENYRPVSLLPVISKAQERCVVSRLVPHVKNVLYPFQHGFQRGKSCVSQLLEVFQDIRQALDRGVETDIIYLDFAKAFDSVCPAKLVTKLKLYGIGEPLLLWFYSYLVGRAQRVVVNGTCSTWTEVGSGVPQGPILGPILFLLFVNDMPNVVSSARIAMFADDSKCYKIIEQASDFVNL